MGKNYFSNGYRGKRILVLGESHYCSDLNQGGRCFPYIKCKKENMLNDCFSFTKDVINSFVYDYSGGKEQQTFLCFERAIVGKELSQEEREEFWQGVIFYNYIQFSQSGPGLPPHPEHWAESELAFKEVLEKYMPDYIIVWGVRLYNGLPNWNGEGSILHINENAKTDVWTYNIKGKKIPAMKVHHPCTPRGKKWRYWHEFHTKFLNM